MFHLSMGRLCRNAKKTTAPRFPRQALGIDQDAQTGRPQPSKDKVPRNHGIDSMGLIWVLNYWIWMNLRQMKWLIWQTKNKNITKLKIKTPMITYLCLVKAGTNASWGRPQDPAKREQHRLAAESQGGRQGGRGEKMSSSTIFPSWSSNSLISWDFRC